MCNWAFSEGLIKSPVKIFNIAFGLLILSTLSVSFSGTTKSHSTEEVMTLIAFRSGRLDLSRVWVWLILGLTGCSRMV